MSVYDYEMEIAGWELAVQVQMQEQETVVEVVAVAAVYLAEGP